MRFARRLLIFCYGLFTIAAQGLLFREFLTTFEGNDIGVGAFFGSWFLWVGLGALAIYRSKFLAETFLRRIELLFLAYIPAFVLQWILILQARELAGIEYWVLFPVRLMLGLSVVLNAPVSFITGMFFPLACRWVRHEALPVSRVYITEAAGSFAGGLGITILLGVGTSSGRIFLILAFIVSMSVFLVRVAGEKKRWGSILAPALVVVCLFAGADKALMSKIRIIKWGKLLPTEALEASFQTAQAEYLYGVYQGQWMAVRQGSVCEALPVSESAGQIAAIGLCQNPDATRVLVIGSGLGLCNAFLGLDQIERVTWTHCDNEYVQKVQDFVPDELRITDERFRPFAGDVRSVLVEEEGYYDIVVLNLPDVTSSVLNRYYTLEFYRQVKRLLRAGGVFQVRISGGENIMGTELVNLGASTKLTLERVFSRFALTPGDETWFVASDSENLTGEPGKLVDRFAAIEGAKGIFPAEGLFSVYLPERSRIALESYSSADLPERLLINRDGRPLAHLYSLLLAAKQSGAVVTRFAKDLALAGVAAFVIPVLVFVGLRIIYVLKMRGGGRESGFESTFIVFSAGWVGIGVVIVLMYLYQTRFGSLYLHIGVISSIFMIGLTGGGGFSRYLLVSRRMSTTALLFVTVLAHTLVLVVVGQWPEQQWSHPAFAIAFALAGFCTGMYFPLGAGQLAACGFEAGRSGSKLEMSDHIGAAAGAFLTGLAIVPVLGARQTMVIFILLLNTNLLLAGLSAYRPQKLTLPDTPAFRLRRLGYILFGAGACVVLCSNVLSAAGAAGRPALPYRAVQALAGAANVQSEVQEAAEQLRAEPASGFLEQAGKKINYYKLIDSKEKPAGYIFSSQELAPEVTGFGGKMNLAILVEASGRLVDFHILRSNETPAYLELLVEWRAGLKGRSLFSAGVFDDVQAVSGATVSSEAIMSGLEKSGRRFAAEILGQEVAGQAAGETNRWASLVPDVQGVYLVSAFVLALIVTFYGSFTMRLVVLLFMLVVGGIILNSQYSSEQIATLLSGHFPAAGLTGAFLLLAGVPVFAAVFGNYYCGYICPFGAVQELAGYITGERFRSNPRSPNMRKARFVKYVLLLVAVSVFFISRNRQTLQTDPLIEVFSGKATDLLLLIGGAALVGSVFYGRFWCRYLCPAGAFLSLVGGVGVLKKFLPAKRFGRCEYGVGSKAELDCLFCDRCRYVPKQKISNFKFQISNLKIYLLVPVLVVAFFISAVSVRKSALVIGAGFGQVGAMVAGGQSRDVDIGRVRTMIRQQRLSDQEAEFYKKVGKDSELSFEGSKSLRDKE